MGFEPLLDVGLYWPIPWRRCRKGSFNRISGTLHLNISITLIKVIVRDVFSLVIKYLAGVPGPSRPAGWCIQPDTEMEAANIHRVVWPSFSTRCLPEPYSGFPVKWNEIIPDDPSHVLHIPGKDAHAGLNGTKGSEP